MNEQASNQRMILCAGLQSGGTTLVSWCFLQRKDTNGVLDMKQDLIYTDFERVQEPMLWVKMTVSAFRWLDVCQIYEDFGWKPEPLLVVRDVRKVYSSLRAKPYGVNGTTAEDPPLRMRFRRFLRDWEMFRANKWPIIRFEDVLLSQEAPLRKVCSQLMIAWDDDMVQWPKPLESISYVGTPNRTFASSIGAGCLAAAILPEDLNVKLANVPCTEMKWLESTFAEYNKFHGYELEMPCNPAKPSDEDAHLPRFVGTKRQRIIAAMDNIQWLREAMTPP